MLLRAATSAASSWLFQTLAENSEPPAHTGMFYMADRPNCSMVLPDFEKNLVPDRSGPEPQQIVLVTGERDWLQGGDDAIRLETLLNFLRRARCKSHQWNHRGDLFIELTDGDFLLTVAWNKNQAR